MYVTYTPPLMEQIRRCRPRVVVVRAPNGFVQRVDPVTREATGVPQQFLKHAGGSLTILPPNEWVAAPHILDVDGVRI